MAAQQAAIAEAMSGALLQSLEVAEEKLDSEIGAPRWLGCVVVCLPF